MLMRSTSLTRLLFATATLFYTSSAFAVFDVQALAGKRWYVWENGKNGDEDLHLSAQQITVAAHVDPIPGVPVAFGVNAAMLTLNKDDLRDFEQKIDKTSGLEVGIDVLAWIPMVPMFSPYIRATYPVMSKYVIEGSGEIEGEAYKVAASYKSSGYHLDLGLRFSPAPLIGILVEVGKGFQKFKAEEYKLDGEKLDDLDAPKQGFNSNVVLVGLQVGI